MKDFISRDFWDFDFSKSHFTDYNVSDFPIQQQQEANKKVKDTLTWRQDTGEVQLDVKRKSCEKASDEFNKITKFNVACSSHRVYISYWRDELLG